MEQKFLKDLGLEDEVITKILAENNKDLKDLDKVKTNAETYKTELEGIKKQLSERDKDIETLKNQVKDNETLTTNFNNLQQKYKEDTEKLQKEKTDMQFNHILNSALSGSKAKNLKAVKALLNFDALKLDGETILGLKEQIENVKKDNDYLFESDKPDIPDTPPSIVPPITPSSNKPTNPFLFSFQKLRETDKQ